MDSARRLWRYDLGLAVCLAALYAEVLFGDARIVGRDVLHYLVPLGDAVGAGLRGDGALGWDAGVNHGLPLAARWSPMVFYPVQWLNAVLAPLTVIAIGVLLHLWLAGAALLRLALRYTDSVPSAWVAALSFCAGGYLVSVTVGGGYLFGAALLPLSLLAVHRLVEAPSPARIAQLAAVFALQLFAADPQTPFYEGLVLAPAIGLGHARSGAAGELRRRVVALAAAGALGIAAGTCQWLPAAELGGLSVRAQGTEAASAWALHPLRVLQFFSPALFGGVHPENTFWARWLVDAEFTVPWAPVIYFGLLPWAGLAALRGSRRVVGVAALTAFFLLMAFGAHTPLFGLVTRLPIAGIFRYPEKFLSFVTLGLCLLAAVGLGQLGEASPRRRWIVAGTFAGLALAAIAAGQVMDAAWFTETLRAHAVTHVDAGAARAATAGALTHTAIFALVVGAFVFAGRRLPARLLPVVPALIAIADVLPASMPVRFLASGAAFADVPAACAALPPPDHGLPTTIFRPTRALPYRGTGDDGTRFERQRRWEWDTLKANVGAMTCARHAAGYEAGQLLSHAKLWNAFTDDERRFQFLGVQRLIAPIGALDAEKFPVAQTSPALGIAVHAVRDPLPFATPLGAAVTVANDDDARRQLGALDFRQAVLLERALPSADHGPAARTATLKSYAPGRIAIDTDFERPGYLRVLESAYPGWTAGPLKVERADGHFLGLEVPAGHTEVRLVFDPPLQHAANWISIGAAVAVGLLAASGALRRRLARP